MISEENLQKAAVLGYMPDEVLRESGVDPELLESLAPERERLDEVLKRFLTRSSPESVSWLLYRIMTKGGKGLKDAIFISQVFKTWWEENQEIMEKACRETRGGLSMVLKVRSIAGNIPNRTVEHP